MAPRMGSGVSGAIMPFQSRPGPPTVQRRMPRELGDRLAFGFGFVLLTLLFLDLVLGVGGLVEHFAARGEQRIQARGLRREQ